jgi:putative transposase
VSSPDLAITGAAGQGDTAPKADFAPVTSLGFIPARNDVYIDGTGAKRRLLYLERGNPTALNDAARQPGASNGRELLAILVDIGPGAQHSLPYTLTRREFFALLQNGWRKFSPALTPGQLPQRVKTSKKAAAEVTRRWDVLTKIFTAEECPELTGRCMVDDLRLAFKPGRKKLLLTYQKALGVTAKTLMGWLLMYWKGGMNRDALRPNFDARGKETQELDEAVLLARKAPGRARDDGQPTFRLAAASKKHILEAVKLLETEKRKTVARAYKECCKNHWQTIDSDANVQLLPIGQMPSYQQFYRLLRKNLPLYFQLFRQAGPGHVFNNYQGRTGSVLQEAVCAGHQYEVDSTQADIWLVAEKDSNKIIGKPTLYFIIDRFSRLVVGWHATLDNPSWHGACEAFLSIFEDPEALANELGVKYRGKRAHPAVALACCELIADRGGEYICVMSDHITENIRVGVVNLPANMCSEKGSVECLIKLDHVTLQDVAPGYQPPAEAMKRFGADYEHDAKWTLDEFRAYIMEFVYLHNLRVHPKLPRRVHAVDDGYLPIPLDVFTRDAEDSGTMLTALDPVDVYWELLAQRRGVVTNTGVVLHGLHYSCPEIEELGWLIRGGLKRFRVEVKYDRRLTDRIFILNPLEPGAFFTATLTPAYEMYGRRSFAEAQRVLRIIKQQAAQAERYNLQLELQLEYDRRERVARADKLAMEAINRAKALGISRISGRVELREEEASERSLALAEKRQQALLGGDNTPAADGADTQGGTTQNQQPQTVTAAIAVADTEDPDIQRDLDLILLKDPLAALHKKGH